MEAGIKSGKIQKDASASKTVKKPFPAKKEASAGYSQKGLGRTKRRPTVGAVMIQNSSNDQPRNNQSRPNQQWVEQPQRQFTRINMTPAQVLPHLLKLNLTSLKEAPKNPNTSSPYYHSNAKCAYHSDSAGHDTNNCWALKNKIQDLIDAKEVEFDAPEKPNVISTPMPNHNHNVHAVLENLHVTDIVDLLTPLFVIKENLLKAGSFLVVMKTAIFV